MQSDASSQEFYSRTVSALDKKEKSDAEVARKLHEVKDDATAHKPQLPIGGSSGQKPLADDSDRDKSHVEIEVPQRLPTDKAAQMKAPSDNRPSEDKADGEKSVAGRKTMQKGEPKKGQSAKESPLGGSKEKTSDSDTEKKEALEETQESKEAHEVEQEINSILKRSPSVYSHPCFRLSFILTSCVNSNYLLKIVLSPFKESKDYIQQIQHRSSTFRRRTGPASLRLQNAGHSRENDGKKDSP